MYRWHMCKYLKSQHYTLKCSYNYEMSIVLTLLTWKLWKDTRRTANQRQGRHLSDYGITFGPKYLHANCAILVQWAGAQGTRKTKCNSNKDVVLQHKTYPESLYVTMQTQVSECNRKFNNINAFQWKFFRQQHYQCATCSQEQLDCWSWEVYMLTTQNQI